jgi:DNA-directed RNA polymerase specialized sigma24 family protein
MNLALATWVSAVPEPQRSALALFYLNEFTYREILSLLDLKVNELATLIARGRSLFQAWLKTTTDAE